MTFSFHRGSLALDFVGTVGRRASDPSEERLPNGAALVTWLRAAGLVAPARVSGAELALARGLRESLHTLGIEALEGKGPSRAALRVLNEAAGWVREGALRLEPTGKVAWLTAAPLRFSLGRVAEDAAFRFSHDADRLTRCDFPGCGALLLSHSRSERRRWCSMETCGNRAKVAAFRARRKRAAGRRT